MEVSARLSDAVRRDRPELWENQTLLLHHDNASAHPPLFIRSYLAQSRASVVLTPSYFPDLAPADLFLFHELKITLKERRFQPTEEIQENAIRELRSTTESAFQEAFKPWKKRWELCR